MSKIVVADDEAFVFQSICTSINWKEIGLNLVGACKDGMEAWHAILDENPDLVMTDIRMPGLSGLELIEKTKEISPQTVFIILSGYQEFEYARTAMQYGVRHYLIKPCSCEKMEEVLREAIQEQKHQKPMPFHLASLILQSQTKCLTILYFLSFYTFDTLCFGWHFCNTFVISPKEFICFLY